MDIKITLGALHLVKTDITSPIILPEKFNLIIDSGRYVAKELSVAVTCGGAEYKYKTAPGEALDISQGLDRAGKVDISIKYIERGEVLKSWRIEPLYFKEVNHGFEVIPEIEALKSDILLLKNALLELTDNSTNQTF